MGFEEIPYKKDIISNIFPSHEDFRKKVKDALKWSENGGPEIGTSGFVRAVIEGEKLSQDEFREISQKIRKEAGIIKKIERGGKDKTETFSKKQKENMMKGAIELEQDELERSGGIDPNDI